MTALPILQEPGRLAARLRSGEFAVTCELSPPRGATTEPLQRKAVLIRDWVDAALVTDGQGAQVRMAGWAGAVSVMAGGVEPILLLQGRDRNRLALQADLLGAAGIGFPNVVLQTGDDVRHGDEPEAASAFDLDSVSAIEAAHLLKHDKRLLSGRELSVSPRWLIGAVENATSGDERRLRRLRQKVDAGAQFVMTQYVFDLPRFDVWMRRVRDLGLNQHCAILAGVGPVTSARGFSFLEALPDVHIPDAIKKRLRGVPQDRLKEEGVALCIETLQAVREIEGVAGVYLLASNREELIPRLLEESGIGRRRIT